MASKPRFGCRSFSFVAAAAFASVVGIAAIATTPDASAFRGIAESGPAAERPLHAPSDAVAVLTKLEKRQTPRHITAELLLAAFIVIVALGVAFDRRRDRRPISRPFQDAFLIRRRGPPLRPIAV